MIYRIFFYLISGHNISNSTHSTYFYRCIMTSLTSKLIYNALDIYWKRSNRWPSKVGSPAISLNMATAEPGSFSKFKSCESEGTAFEVQKCNGSCDNLARFCLRRSVHLRYSACLLSSPFLLRLLFTCSFKSFFLASGPEAALFFSCSSTSFSCPRVLQLFSHFF